MKRRPDLKLTLLGALGLTVALGPIAWLTGATLLLFPLLAGLFALAYFRTFRLNAVLLLGLVLVAHLATRAGSYLVTTGDWSRTFAAIYNLVVLVTGLIFFSLTAAAIRKHGQHARALLSSYAQVTFFFTAALLLGSWLIAFTLPQTHNYVVAPTLVGLVINTPLTGILETSRTAIFTRADWGAGMSLPRSVVLAGFPTSSAMAIVSLGYLSLLGLRPNQRWRAAAINVLVVICVVLTLTRTVAVGIILGATASLLIGRKGIFHWLALVGIFMGFLASAAYLATEGDLQGAQSAADYRAQSTETRFADYEQAFALGMAQGPLLGIGVKPRDDDFLQIPIGSHSSLLGMFLKGGVVGAILIFSLMFVLPAMAWIRLARACSGLDSALMPRARLMTRYLFILYVWLLFEDIDAYVYITTLVFVCIAAMATSDIRTSLKKGHCAAHV